MTYDNKTRQTMDNELYEIYKQMVEIGDKARANGFVKTYDAIYEALGQMQIAIGRAWEEEHRL